MIDYDEVIQKIREGDFLFRDRKGDTLLHSLAACEEYKHVPVEPVLALLIKSPHLADEKNKLGQTPAEVLDGCQLHSHTSNRPFRRILYQYITHPVLKEKLEKSIHMSFVEQFHNDPNESYRVIPSQESDSVLKRPTLLLFSGRGNYALPLINGFGRLMRKTLGIYQQKVEDFQVVSVRYPGTQRDLCNDFLISGQPIERQLENPDHPRVYVRSFVERYMRPLYLDERGCRKPIGEIVKNMRLLNMIGYSYGSFVIQAMSDIMREDMIDSGFKKPEIALAQSQMLVLHMGPALNQYHYQSGFRNFHILNTQDDVVGMDMLEMVPKWNAEKTLIRTNIQKQKNQIVLLINTLENNTEHAPHHINTYCNPANRAQEVALLWGKSILFNGLANSVQNAKSNGFIPLPENLEQIPNAFVKRQKISLGTSMPQATYRRKLKDAAERTKA